MKFKGLIIFAIFALAVMGFAVPQAKAQDGVTAYADVLMWTGLTMRDKDAANKFDDNNKAIDDMDLVMGLTPQGSMGVRGSANNVFVNFAIMAKTPGASFIPDWDKQDENSTYMFIGLISYRVGEASFTIGRFFTPYDQLDFNNIAASDTTMGWDMMLGYSLFDATREQIRVDYKGFYFGLFKNNKNETEDTNVLIPMIAAGYMHGNPGTAMRFSVHGLFQTYTIEDARGDYDLDGDGMIADPAEKDQPNPLYEEAVNSWAVAADFGMKMDAIGFNVHGHYGVNTGDMGVQGGSSINNYAKKEVSDSTTMAGWAGVDYTVDKMKLSAGIGYSVIDNDLYEKEDQKMTYYVACKYSIQPNFAITPIVRVINNMKGPKNAWTGLDYSEYKEGQEINIGFLTEAHI